MSVPEIIGLYKLSSENVNKCIQRTLVDIHGNRVPGCSKNEIATLIYLTQIADQKGKIEAFKASMIMQAISCSKRDSFLIINNLQQKGFIQIENRTWTGYMDIRILNNDFSQVKKYDKNVRYLNTNRPYFDRTDFAFYNAFRNLSLYATKLLLYVLCAYNIDYGYHITYMSLTSVLSVKSRSLIHKYLEELQPILGALSESSFYESYPDLKKGFRYGRIKIPFRNTMFIANKGITEKQDSYYKRYWLSKFNDGTYEVDGHATSKESFASILFQIVLHYINEFKVTRTFVENVIDEQIKYYGILSERTIYHINERLSSLCSSY